MKYKLTSKAKKGDMVKTAFGWRKIRFVDENGVHVKEGFIGFGYTIFGWKTK